jgi:hypothetical protein
LKEGVIGYFGATTSPLAWKDWGKPRKACYYLTCPTYHFLQKSSYQIHVICFVRVHSCLCMFSFLQFSGFYGVFIRAVSRSVVPPFYINRNSVTRSILENRLYLFWSWNFLAEVRGIMFRYQLYEYIFFLVYSPNFICNLYQYIQIIERRACTVSCSRVLSSTPL